MDLEATTLKSLLLNLGSADAHVTGVAGLSRVEVRGPQPLVDAAAQAADDLRKTGHITGDLVFTADAAATEISVSAELAPVEG